MDIRKKINFKQPKYIIPLIAYVGVLFVGYMVISIFTSDNDDKNSRLKTTSYLNSDLPDANVDSTLTDKMTASEDEYGNISDETAVGDLQDDKDSVNKKASYESGYNEMERRHVEAAQAQREMQEQEARDRSQMLQMRRMQNRIRSRNSGGSSSSDDSFVDPVSDNVIAREQRRRRQREMAAINRDLTATYGNAYSGGDTYNDSPLARRDLSSSNRYASAYGQQGQNGYGSAQDMQNGGYGGADGYAGADNYQNGGYQGQGGNGYNGNIGGNGSNAVAGDGHPMTVIKKNNETSSYFNTITAEKKKSKLISAIIDENVKAYDGSRVRLRLLDDIEIGGMTVKKGTYLYATMSGFGSQRVKGTVSSIFYDDEIMDVSLSIYDTDGLEGLYVPVSQFRQTAKDVASESMSGGTQIMESTGSSTGIKGWASQTAQNATQKVMSAFSSAFKKNRARLKYGTRVYLVDQSMKRQARK
ncbi:MAG: conjugative transposon protein TraM [Prevotellaceae bacterium]|nr:conjugative transposon protein TraM [Prevotellaceae bacterium]